MKQSVMTDLGMTLGPSVALLGFVVIFAVVLLWIYRPGSGKTYAEESQLPLDDGAAPRAHADSPQGEDHTPGPFPTPAADEQPRVKH